MNVQSFYLLNQLPITTTSYFADYWRSVDNILTFQGCFFNIIKIAVNSEEGFLRSASTFELNHLYFMTPRKFGEKILNNVNLTSITTLLF
jgi:hypothetical protein